MGLLKILRKIKRKEKEMRLLMLSANHHSLNDHTQPTQSKAR